MEHTKSKVIVYQSEDYKRFRFIDGNRETEVPASKNTRIRIMKEIEGGNDILNESPILVSENGSYLIIKDGQNRFLIAKELKRPVHYIIKKQELSLYNLAKINSNVEKWTSTNYINCYIKAGNENYVQIKKFQKKYGISISMTLQLLTNGTEKPHEGRDDLLGLFQEGKFEVKKYKDAYMIAELCMGFKEFDGWYSRPFILSIIKILQAGKCDFDRLMTKFNRDPKRLSVHANVMGYVQNLELIYNLDNQNRKTIV